MIKFKYGEIYLSIIDGYDIAKSSQAVQFSSLKCDFTDYLAKDLPQKYQEVTLVDINSFGIEKTLYTGYIDKIEFDEMREVDVETIINISLLSPMMMSTLRTTTAVGTYKLKELLENTILTPLLDDGFTIKTIEVSDRTITTNYLCETVEYCMNDLSNKYNFWWFIDEYKRIYVKDISKMFKQSPDYIYDNEHRINGLESIKPIIESDNYANVVNFKNVRIYEYSKLKFEGKLITEAHNPLISSQISNLKKEGKIEFNYPIDITEKNIKKSADSNGTYGTIYGLQILGTYSDNTSFELFIRINPDNTFEFSENIGFDGDTDSTAEFLLIRDSFFSNLIIGFKYNNENKNIKSISSIKSDSILAWNVNKVYNDKAIAEKRGKVSKTGIIELTINMQESWKTIQELREIAISYMDKNSLEFDGQVEIRLDDSNNMQVGNTIYINKLLMNGTYVITQIKETNKNNDFEYIITAKKTNLLENFIDIFRGETNQTSSDKIFKIYITHYVEDTIEEIHEVLQ